MVRKKDKQIKQNKIKKNMELSPPPYILHLPSSINILAVMISRYLLSEASTKRLPKNNCEGFE